MVHNCEIRGNQERYVQHYRYLVHRGKDGIHITFLSRYEAIEAFRNNTEPLILVSLGGIAVMAAVLAIVSAKVVFTLVKNHQKQKEFITSASHELKTPLTSISGFAEIIQAGIAKEEDVKRFAGKIYDESRRLLHLVNDIIQLSELDEEGMAQKKEPCSLKSITEDVVEKLSGSAAKQKVKITTDLADLRVLGIYSVLHEMVYNVVENAIKYNKEKGEVKIKLKEKGDFVELLVKDTGIGIPFEMQERVFERFYRVDKSHSKEIGGTGLGLSIVKHGANIHHATIQLDSTLGKGTKISLDFPKYVEEQSLVTTANH